MNLETNTSTPKPSIKGELLQLGREIEGSSVNQKNTADIKNLLFACRDPNSSKNPTTIVPEKKKKWIAPRSPERTKDEPDFIKIGSSSLTDAISNSDSEKILNSETKSSLWNKLVQYLKSIDRDNQPIFSPDDEITFGKDETGPYLIFLRGKKSSPKIRP